MVIWPTGFALVHLVGRWHFWTSCGVSEHCTFIRFRFLPRPDVLYFKRSPKCTYFVFPISRKKLQLHNIVGNTLRIRYYIFLQRLTLYCVRQLHAHGYGHGSVFEKSDQFWRRTGQDAQRGEVCYVINTFVRSGEGAIYRRVCFYTLQVLEQVRDELLDCGCGISVMELSHRSSEYTAINNRAIDLYRELL